MWANAQRDGRPAEYRWRPLFNAAKFGHIVLDGDPALRPPEGHSPSPPIFGPYPLQPNGCIDQDAT